jgi:hypothetical protein
MIVCFIFEFLDFFYMKFRIASILKDVAGINFGVCSQLQNLYPMNLKLEFVKNSQTFFVCSIGA